MLSLSRIVKAGFIGVFATGISMQGAYAQPGAIEICPGAGISVNSNPGSNMSYKGDQLTLNYSALLSGMFNIHRSMSAGIELRALQLSRSHDGVYTTYLGTTIGGGKRFVYSKAALSACAIFNGKYNTYRGYIYGGGAAGYAVSNHDSRKLNTNESYRAPAGGSGLVLGVQAGYTHGLNAVLGLNIEGALRNYSLGYDAGAPEVRPYTNLQYNITAYTLTVGLKIRIMPKYKAQNAIPAQRGNGRSRRF
ncbi:MAG TPA: hypothetical protein VIN07_09240 [Flavipsychrobacter sp.]